MVNIVGVELSFRLTVVVTILALLCLIVFWFSTIGNTDFAANALNIQAGANGKAELLNGGNGKFLPESKRGLPTPAVSFYKIFGLSMLFPKSKTFAKYHLGYLEEDETNEIEVLSGAFMWMRRSVLDEVGFLDEDFFITLAIFSKCFGCSISF